MAALYVKPILYIYVYVIHIYIYKFINTYIHIYGYICKGVNSCFGRTERVVKLQFYSFSPPCSPQLQLLLPYLSCLRTSMHLLMCSCCLFVLYLEMKRPLICSANPCCVSSACFKMWTFGSGAFVTAAAAAVSAAGGNVGASHRLPSIHATKHIVGIVAVVPDQIEELKQNRINR